MARDDTVGHGQVGIQGLDAAAQGSIRKIGRDDDVVGDITAAERGRTVVGENTGSQNTGVAVDRHIFQQGAAGVHRNTTAATQVGIAAHRVAGNIKVAQGGGVAVQQDAATVTGEVGNSTHDDAAAAGDPEAVDLGIKSDIANKAQGGVAQIPGDDRRRSFNVPCDITGIVPTEKFDASVIQNDTVVQRGRAFDLDRITGRGAVDGIEQGRVLGGVLLHIVPESSLEIDAASTQQSVETGVLGVDVVAGGNQGGRNGLPRPGRVGGPQEGRRATGNGGGETGALYGRISVRVRIRNVGSGVDGHAGGGQVDPGSVIGEGGLGVAVVGGGHRKNTRHGRHVVGNVIVVVARRSNHQGAGALGCVHGGDHS